MVKGAAAKIEGFRERLEWMMTNCEFDSTVRGLLGAPDHNGMRGFKDLLHYIHVILDSVDERYPSPQVWDKHLKGEVAVASNIITAILTIYPSMPRELLTLGSIRDFRAKTADLAKGLDRWEMSTTFVESNRGRLADEAKKYYAEVDATPDFPVITDKGWILNELQPLTEDDSPHHFKAHVARQSGQELTDWIGKYTDIKKKRLSPEGRARLWNGDMFRVMDVIAKDGKLSFSLAPGSFYEYIDTCEVLGAEFANHLVFGGGQQPTSKELPMRGDPSDAFNLWARMVPLGVSCLCILKNYPVEDGKLHDVFLMHERGKNTTAGQNTWHVAPAGGYAPVSMTDTNPAQRRIWATVVREFIEECFDIEDAQLMAKTYDELLASPMIKPLVDNFFRKRDVSKVFLMGVGLDPVTMALDAMVAIVIDWKKADRSNWDDLPNIRRGGRHLRMIHSYEASSTRFVPLDSADDFLSEAKRVDGKPVHPAGKACLIQGARFFSDLMKSVDS